MSGRWIKLGGQVIAREHLAQIVAEKIKDELRLGVKTDDDLETLVENVVRRIMAQFLQHPHARR